MEIRIYCHVPNRSALHTSTPYNYFKRNIETQLLYLTGYDIGAEPHTSQPCPMPKILPPLVYNQLRNPLAGIWKVSTVERENTA